VRLCPARPAVGWLLPNGRPLVQSLPQKPLALAKPVVNDKGRYGQHPETSAPETFRLRPKFQADHSPHLETSVCFRCTVRCSHRGVAKKRLSLFQFAFTNMAQAGGRTAKVVGRQIVYACLFGASLHRRTRLRWLSHSGCSIPPFKCRMIQASTSSLHHDGTGTVRSRAPLPTKLTMTH
jgi:hypothetical protein